MGSENLVMARASAMAAPKTSDALDNLGENTLSLIRQAALATSEQAEPPANDVVNELMVRVQAAEVRLTTLETNGERHANIGQYLDSANTLLALTERRLIQLTDQFNANQRKFVDTIALFEVAGKRNAELQKELQEKEQEITNLKQSSFELIDYLKLLLKLVDGCRQDSSFPSPTDKTPSEKLLPR
jgi:predicted RNase H-like nuclease (RuvC/YqgF family)